MKIKSIESGFISEVDLAKWIGCDRKTFWRARRNGKPIFPFKMIGDRPMYSRDVVIAIFSLAGREEILQRLDRLNLYKRVV